jgi:hypothetical protein
VIQRRSSKDAKYQDLKPTLSGECGVRGSRESRLLQHTRISQHVVCARQTLLYR